ncbi:MAG: saccharopine dehydrogenase NADP-binding domain-containing protein [Parafilimonas sp.]|nr:saccharopine dehydrogenase NADP-binding domain-containing protein [Parafilimonas sp.]
MNIAVLGAGMVGRVMAIDLAKNHNVTSIDINEGNLQSVQIQNAAIKTIKADLKDYALYKNLLPPFDLVVTAVPGFMGFDTLKAVIEAGKDVADISFFPENALELDALAKEKNVTVITDCGVAPGMSNYIIGRHNAEMQIYAFEIYVGGLPKIRKKPFEYKAPFSPVDVIEEYTRPARLMENGSIVVKPALTERDWMQFDEIGTLETFNTDGLRSLLFTMPHIKNQKEKTLRYPGHIDLIIALKESGFFNEEKINVNGNEISPLQFTSKILFNEWKLGEEEEELTVMKVILRSKEKTIEYSLLDCYDTATKTSSMSRTTGYTCTASANLIAKKVFNEKGVFPPELVGNHKTAFDFVMNYLKERNVVWNKKENLT